MVGEIFTIHHDRYSARYGKVERTMANIARDMEK